MPDGGSFTPRVPPELPEKPKPLKWGVKWAEDGMEIWLPWSREKGTAIRCKVACAMGDTVRIVNEHYKVDTWKRLDNLMVREGDPHAWD